MIKNKNRINRKLPFIPSIFKKGAADAKKKNKIHLELLKIPQNKFVFRKQQKYRVWSGFLILIEKKAIRYLYYYRKHYPTF